MNPAQKEMAEITNKDKQTGPLTEIIKDKDVFIGVSAPNIVTAEMVSTMADDAIIFAMANPTPEIMPDEAKKGGARVIATGRSDFPNQINNVLVFPGIFRGALDARAGQITEEIIKTVKNIAPCFGGINLEDISAPRCFEIERRLKEELDIPVFHDDQHGTAIVVAAGLLNALKFVGKKMEDANIVINGAGSAGISICKLLLQFGAGNVV